MYAQDCHGRCCTMWFDPTAIAQRSPPPATSATSATSAKKTGDDAPMVAGVAEVATPLCRGNETTSYCWLTHFSDRDPVAVAFSPAATHAEVMSFYPESMAAEPADEVRRQPDTMLTGDQETASAAWLAQIGESDEAIVGEVLAQCRHDEDARQYFTGRAAALPHRPRGWKAFLPVYPCHPREPAPAPGGARGSLS
jgi:hypothetical protein